MAHARRATKQETVDASAVSRASGPVALPAAEYWELRARSEEAAKERQRAQQQIAEARRADQRVADLVSKLEAQYGLVRDMAYDFDDASLQLVPRQVPKH